MLIRVKGIFEVDTVMDVDDGHIDRKNVDRIKYELNEQARQSVYEHAVPFNITHCDLNLLQGPDCGEPCS